MTFSRENFYKWIHSKQKEYPQHAEEIEELLICCLSGIDRGHSPIKKIGICMSDINNLVNNTNK